MLKKIISLCTVIALLMCVCACSSEEDNYSSESVEVIYKVEEEYIDKNGEVVTTSESDERSVTEASSEENNSSKNETTVSSNVAFEGENSMHYLNDADVLSKIKLNGRCEKNSKGINLNFVASAIEFNAECTGALVTLDAQKGVYFAVFVDGVQTQERIVTANGINYIILAKNLASGKHNFKLVRETDSSYNSAVTATSLQFEGKFADAPAKSDTLIEFIGDSLTSGSCNLANTNTSNPYANEYQNGLKAYPYLIASQLGYDYRIVSKGGIGIQSNMNLPEFVDFYNLECFFADRSAPYNSSSPEDVDIVVVNLGTNDVWYRLLDPTNKASVDDYSQRYANIITGIGYRKDAKILFVTGVSTATKQSSAIEGAITKLKALGYTNVSLYQAGTYIAGGDNHPTADEHALAAKEIIEAMRKNSII